MLNRYAYRLLCGIILLPLSACAPLAPVPPAQVTDTRPAASNPALTPTPVFTENTPLPAASPSLTPTSTPTLAPSLTPSQAPTATPVPTETPTASPSPTHAVLRGRVITERVICHYGPGKPYLYKYGLVGGSNLEIIRRLDPPTFLEVRAIGGDNPCWVNAEHMEVHGDILAVEPIDPREASLPYSPYYGPLSGVSASRSGEKVTISWSPLVLKEGDDSEQYLYLVEAWLCQQGQVVFTPVGTYQTAVQLTDEPGCAEPSSARVFGVEKHGYTKWVEVPWPPAG